MIYICPTCYDVYKTGGACKHIKVKDILSTRTLVPLGRDIDIQMLRRELEYYTDDLTDESIINKKATIRIRNNLIRAIKIASSQP